MKPSAFWGAIAFSVALTSGSQADTGSLSALVAKKAAIIRNMHDRAAKAIVQVAQDPAFPGYFEAMHDGHDHGAKEAKVRIDQISLATQDRFHVEEMCLIDSTGTEVSRIVANQIAYDLSTEEADNAFFKPSFEREPRSTYIAPLYVSPDAFKWVMAYTTPIEVDGKNAAILHYEHGLDVYQAALNREVLPPGTWLVAVDSHGYVVSDSRKTIDVAQRGDSENLADYFELFDLAGLSLTELDASLGEAGAADLEYEGKTFAVAKSSVVDWTIIAVEEHE
jgi:hypothetical protein